MWCVRACVTGLRSCFTPSPRIRAAQPPSHVPCLSTTATPQGELLRLAVACQRQAEASQSLLRGRVALA